MQETDWNQAGTTDFAERADGLWQVAVSSAPPRPCVSFFLTFWGLFRAHAANCSWLPGGVVFSVIDVAVTRFMRVIYTSLRNGPATDATYSRHSIYAN